MKKLLAGFILLTIMSFSPIPEQTYVWEHYGIQITVPDDFKVVKNTDDEFEMKGVGMGMYMYIFEEDISIDDMDDAVKKSATAIKMQKITAATEISGDGLDGYFVEGVKDGLRVVLAGMIDPKSHTNFLLLISFYDNDDVAVDDAVDIINSVHSIK